MKSGNTLLFGRITYEMMAGFWPTEMAAQIFPDVAKGMNAAKKIVFSNSMKKADWKNTTIIGGDIVKVVRKLKETGGDDLTILGSGSIVATLADAGLIDTFGIMIDPVALPEGAAIFSGITKKLELKLKNSRTFKSGVVLLTYDKQ
jgi:dihydrofolate reductase